MKGTTVYSRGISVTGRKAFALWSRLKLLLQKNSQCLFLWNYITGNTLGILRPFGPLILCSFFRQYNC